MPRSCLQCMAVTHGYETKAQGMMSFTHKKRMLLSFLGMLICALGCYLVLSAFWENMDVFVSPKDLARLVEGKHARLGGVVQKGSLHRHELDYKFLVEDDVADVMVQFHGVPPALFREGQGVIVEGRLRGKVFVADRVLAKHDENYKPPVVKLKSEV